MYLSKQFFVMLEFFLYHNQTFIIYKLLSIKFFKFLLLNQHFCLCQVLRIDISSSSACDSKSGNLDSAERVYFAPQSLGHLLVTTTNNKLLKFDAKSGRLLSEVLNLVTKCTKYFASNFLLFYCVVYLMYIYNELMLFACRLETFIAVAVVVWQYQSQGATWSLVGTK